MDVWTVLEAVNNRVQELESEVETWKTKAIALQAEVERLQARLRELASAEPDGYAVTEAAGFTACFYDYADAYEHAQEAGGRPIRPLIRRPVFDK